MIKIQENVSLRNLTTFKIGGLARYFAPVNNLEELKEAIAFSQKEAIPFFVLGWGSNILISDNGYSGLIIKNDISETNHILPDGKVIFGSGEGLDNFVKFCVEHSLFGTENLSGIPGTVGGAVVQNAGAYGAEIREIVFVVNVYNIKTGKLEALSNKQCAFAYRQSIFKIAENKKYIIISVIFDLLGKTSVNISYNDLKKHFADQNIIEPTISQVREAVLHIRRGKIPSPDKLGNAGSYFKNPVVTLEKYQEMKLIFPGIPSYMDEDGEVKLSLAWILDKVCNLKGLREGDVGLYEKQPIILVNFGGADSFKVINFAEKIKNIVKIKTGLIVETEVENLN